MSDIDNNIPNSGTSGEPNDTTSTISEPATPTDLGAENQ